MLGADAHELGALQLARRVAVVHADDGLDCLALLEGLGQPAAPVGGEARDQHAARRRAAVLYPNHTDFRFLTISHTFSWIRARISCATVWTSALSSLRPSASKWKGSRNRIRNLAGR